MRTAKEVLEQLKGDRVATNVEILKSWAEEIIKEAIGYDWTETTWEEQQEQLREIRWKL